MGERVGEEEIRTIGIEEKGKLYKIVVFQSESRRLTINCVNRIDAIFVVHAGLLLQYDGGIVALTS